MSSSDSCCWYRCLEGNRLGQTVVRILDEARPAARAAPVAPHVLENRREPGATVGAWLEAVKRLEGLQHRFLHQVFGLGPVAFEPHRQTEEPIRVRKGFRLECCPHVLAGGSRRLLRHARFDPQPLALDHLPGRTIYSRCGFA